MAVWSTRSTFDFGAFDFVGPSFFFSEKTLHYASKRVSWGTC